MRFPRISLAFTTLLSYQWTFYSGELCTYTIVSGLPRSSNTSRTCLDLCLFGGYKASVAFPLVTRVLLQNQLDLEVVTHVPQKQFLWIRFYRFTRLLGQLFAHIEGLW